jgi:hypothetical protein
VASAPSARRGQRVGGAGDRGGAGASDLQAAVDVPGGQRPAVVATECRDLGDRVVVLEAPDPEAAEGGADVLPQALRERHGGLLFGGRFGGDAGVVRGGRSGGSARLPEVLAGLLDLVELRGRRLVRARPEGLFDEPVGVAARAAGEALRPDRRLTGGADGDLDRLHAPPPTVIVSLTEPSARACSATA